MEYTSGRILNNIDHMNDNMETTTNFISKRKIFNIKLCVFQVYLINSSREVMPLS